MVVLNNETVNLIKQDIDLGNIVFAGNTIAEYIQSKNPHENITLALRSIKEDLKEILSQYPDEFIAGQIHYNLIHEVLHELGWPVHEYYFDSISLDDDFRVKVIVPREDFGYYIYYSGIKPMVKFSKFNVENEEKSNNC